MLILIAPSGTIHEAADIWIGTLDSKLSPEGQRDAENLAYYDRVVADRIFIAPTAHIAEFTNIVAFPPAEVLLELTDRSMGTLTGRNYRETMMEFPRRNWLAWHRSYWVAPPEGQSFFDISDRVLTVFRTRILPIKSSEHVAIVAAQDVLRILIGYLTKTDEVEVPKISVEPCVPHIINGDLE
jgi:broad specificity phosphatase PhoE